MMDKKGKPRPEGRTKSESPIGPPPTKEKSIQILCTQLLVEMLNDIRDEIKELRLLLEKKEFVEGPPKGWPGQPHLLYPGIKKLKGQKP